MDFVSYLKSKYPDGLYGGECAYWCHNWADFAPVGNSYREKKKFVELYGIIAPNIADIGKGFRAGDIVVTSEGTLFGFGNGHACVLLDPVKMTVAESNYNKDGKVHYGRVVPLNKIFGIIRAPLKVDLGQVELNFSVLINNQKWNVGFLDSLQKDILGFTENKLKVNFFPVLSKCENWSYETILYPMTGGWCSVIKKEYMDTVVKPLASSNDNKPADVFAFIVRPDQWEGSSNFGGELAYTVGRQIQASCAEHDISPFYPDMMLAKHILIHELSHTLHFINGLNDTTHIFDNQFRQLEKVFGDIDWNRIKANLC